MYCQICNSNMVVSATHFEQNKQPKKYSVCKNCGSKTKETLSSFEEILERILEERR